MWANIASPRSARDGAQTINGNKNEYSEVGGAIVQMFNHHKEMYIFKHFEYLNVSVVSYMEVDIICLSS